MLASAWTVVSPGARCNSLDIEPWLQVIALAVGLGGASIGWFANRRKRLIDELGKLLELREKTKRGTREWVSLDAAVDNASLRLHGLSRSPGTGSINTAYLLVSLATLLIVVTFWIQAIQARSGAMVAAAIGITAFAAIPVVANFPRRSKRRE